MPVKKPPRVSESIELTKQRIAKEADPIGFLIDIARGRRVRAAIREGMTFAKMVFPTIDQRKQVAMYLANKIQPDLKAVEVQADDGGAITVVMGRFTHEHVHVHRKDGAKDVTPPQIEHQPEPEFNAPRRATRDHVRPDDDEDWRGERRKREYRGRKRRVLEEPQVSEDAPGEDMPSGLRDDESRPVAEEAGVNVSFQRFEEDEDAASRQDQDQPDDDRIFGPEEDPDIRAINESARDWRPRLAARKEAKRAKSAARRAAKREKG